MLAHLIDIVGRYGYLGMIGLLVVENLGIPIPSEPSYIVGQGYILTGKASYALVIAVLTFGHVLGASISYYFGWQIAKGLRARPKYTESQLKLAAWYKKYGSITVFATRFLGHVRPWSSYVAGVAEVPWLPFFVLTLVGSALFNMLNMIFTRYLIEYWGQSLLLRIAVVVLLSVGVIGVILAAVRRRLSEKRARH